MKNPPTLADACIATALDKKVLAPHPTNQPMRDLLLQVAHARKFVLDKTMSAFLCDLSLEFWMGGLRKRIRLLENTRRMARLPHPLTWIEFDYWTYLAHAKTKYGMKIEDVTLPQHLGWLLRQHPTIETAFTLTEVGPSPKYANYVLVLPVSTMWCTDDTPLPWSPLKPEDGNAEAVVMSGYHSTQVGWTYTWPNTALSASLMNTLKGIDAQAGPDRELVRGAWALLATINDLPVRIENVEPSKGYVARGAYKKFLAHSVVHLTVPETRWRKLVTKTAVMLRKRAHQVRGHFRKDWRHPLSVLCEHEFDDQMTCRNCHGHQIWVHEHQRGDTSVGFVTHDYEVHKDVA